VVTKSGSEFGKLDVQEASCLLIAIGAKVTYPKIAVIDGVKGAVRRRDAHIAPIVPHHAIFKLSRAHHHCSHKWVVRNDEALRRRVGWNRNLNGQLMGYWHQLATM